MMRWPSQAPWSRGLQVAPVCDGHRVSSGFCTQHPSLLLVQTCSSSLGWALNKAGLVLVPYAHLCPLLP